MILVLQVTKVSNVPFIVFDDGSAMDSAFAKA